MAPLDMRILESRDPDGRIAEAIMHGSRVKETDYEALVTHSERFLGPRIGSEDGEQVDLHYSLGGGKRTSTRERRVAGLRSWKATRTEIFRRRRDQIEARQQQLEDRTAKRRAKRHKRERK